MGTVRALSRNISWNYVEAGTSLVVVFLLMPVIVKQLGIVGAGIWTLLNSILFYLRFLDFGFYNSLVKYVAEYAERQAWPTVNGLIGTTTSVLALAGVVALVLSGVVAWLIVPNPHFFKGVPPEQVSELQVATVLLGVDLLIAFPASVLSAVFEGRQRFDVLSAVTVAATLVCALATYLVLELGYGIVALVWVEIAGSLFTTILFALCLQRLVPEVRLRLGPIGGPYLRRIREYSTWTSLNEMLTEGSSELEKPFISTLLSVKLVTPYNLVATVASVIFLAIEPITHVFFPLSSAYDARGDTPRLRQLLIRGTKLVMAISLPFAVAVTAYGEAFIRVWIDEQVPIPDGVVPLVVASFSVTAFVLTASTILLALAKVKEMFWMGIVELVLAVLLMLIAAPRLGLAGLGGSVMLANLLITFLGVIPYACRLLGQSIAEFLSQSLLRPLLAALPMALFILWLDQYVTGASLWWLVLKSGLASGVYLIVFYSLSLTAEERALCYSSVRSVLGKQPQ